MKKILLSILTLTTIGVNAQLNLDWANTVGNAGNDVINDTKTDANGDVYTVGYFEGTVDFGTTSLEFATSNGAKDIFIRKLDGTGNLLWYKTIGGTDDDYAISMDLDDMNGGIVITGQFNNTVDFDPGVGVNNLVEISGTVGANNFDYFVLQLDANGNFGWANNTGGNYGCKVRDIAVDPTSGNICITGGVPNGTVDFDPGVGVSNLTFGSNGNIFIQSLNSMGDFNWVKGFEGTYSYGQSIVFDNAGYIYTTGLFQGTVDFDPGAAVLNITPANIWGLFVLKLDPAGDYVWAKANGGDDYCATYGITVDGNGNVFTTGYFKGIYDFDPSVGVSNFTSAGAEDAFITKLNMNGDYVWNKTFGNTGADIGKSIQTDATGNVFSTGSYTGTVDFDPNANTTNLTSAGGTDVYISKINNNGDFIWASSLGGTANNSPSAITIDASDFVYVSGKFSFTVDFDPNVGTININSNGLNDAFVGKYNQYCNVNIPDANFKTYLVGNAAINTNNDTEIQCTEATAFTGQINCNNLSISDLTGIEAFTALTDLKCHYNSLTSLDLTQNTALTELWCFNNSLTSINVTQNTALSDLRCGDNSLSSLDLTQNTALIILDCSGNSLTSLNVTLNTTLSSLGCSANSLTNLDVNQNTNLIDLYCNNNLLTNLNITQNTAIVELYCNNNSLTSLDVTQNTALTLLYCYDNSLTSLNVANGNNTAITDFYATSNPNLTCIQVDDVAYSTTNWTNIDATASYSTNCNAIMVNSITVQGQGGVSTITTDNGTLTMEAAIFPLNADDQTYTWDVVNGTGSATINVNGILTALTNGTVTVTATANDGSGVTGNAVITISNQTNVGINETNGILSLVEIYPNPTTGQLNFKTNTKINAIEIYNLAGQKVLNFNNTNTININDLTNGIYMAKVFTANGNITTHKIIKK